MHEWMNEWVNEWMNEWMDEWMDGWMNEYAVLVERHRQAKQKRSEEDLSQNHFVQHKSHVAWPWIELGLLRWGTATNMALP
jgi:hypothetical protein